MNARILALLALAGCPHDYEAIAQVSYASSQDQALAELHQAVAEGRLGVHLLSELPALIPEGVVLTQLGWTRADLHLAGTASTRGQANALIDALERGGWVAQPRLDWTGPGFEVDGVLRLPQPDLEEVAPRHLNAGPTSILDANLEWFRLATDGHDSLGNDGLEALQHAHGAQVELGEPGTPLVRGPLALTPVPFTAVGSYHDLSRLLGEWTQLRASGAGVWQLELVHATDACGSPVVQASGQLLDITGLADPALPVAEPQPTPAILTAELHLPQVPAEGLWQYSDPFGGPPDPPAFRRLLRSDASEEMPSVDKLDGLFRRHEVAFPEQPLLPGRLRVVDGPLHSVLGLLSFDFKHDLVVSDDVSGHLTLDTTLPGDWEGALAVLTKAAGTSAYTVDRYTIVQPPDRPQLTANELVPGTAPPMTMDQSHASLTDLTQQIWDAVRDPAKVAEVFASAEPEVDKTITVRAYRARADEIFQILYHVVGASSHVHTLGHDTVGRKHLAAHVVPLGWEDCDDPEVFERVKAAVEAREREWLGKLTQEEQLPPLQRHPLSLYRVAAVTDSERTLALVLDPDGLGYPVELGTVVGARFGKVTSIDAGGIVVTEDFKTPDGQWVLQQTRLPLGLPACTP